MFYKSMFVQFAGIMLRWFKLSEIRVRANEEVINKIINFIDSNSLVALVVE